MIALLTIAKRGLPLILVAVWISSAGAAITTELAFNSTTNFPGITAWPHAVSVDVTALAPNPGAYITVTEGNLGDATLGFNIAQSFTATVGGKLTRIQLPITGMASQTFQLNVYDGLARDWTDISIFDPDMNGSPDPYIPGDTPESHVSADLLTDQTVQTWTGYTLMGATAAVLSFSLTGADQITVEAGKTYIVEFELDPAFNNMLLLGRNGLNADNSTNYTGGQAFRSRRPFNGNAARDFAMAFTIDSSAVLDADFDNSGLVDGVDLNQHWRVGFGKATNVVHADGDANADGDVDGNDLLVWQQQLGTNPTPAVAGAASIPEPAGIAIGAVGLAIFMTARPRLAGDRRLRANHP